MGGMRNRAPDGAWPAGIERPGLLQLVRTSRPVRLLFGIGLLTLAAIIGGTALVIAELRTKKIHDTKQELLTLGVSLAEQTERTIQSVDLILSGLVDQFRLEGVAAAEDYRSLMRGPDTHYLLKTKESGIPQLEAITMIAADGTLLNFSRQYPVPNINLADRDYFVFMKERPTNSSFLSRPVRNRVTGAWTTYLVRRLNGPSGEFVGLVVGAIDLGYFHDLYRALRLGEGASIALLQRDGTLMARHPEIDRVGMKVTTELFDEVLAQGESGSYTNWRSIDGRERLVSVLALPDYPVVVAVTRSLPEVMADWRNQAFVAGISGLTCLVAMMILLWAVARQFGAYEAVTRALAERQQAVQAREEAEARLLQSQKMEALGQLTGGVAHDFNNLLQTIRSSLYLIRSRGMDEKTPMLVRMAEQAVDHGSTLTRQLLAFSRRQHLEPKAVDVGALVKGMASLLDRTLGGAVHVELETEACTWPALVDPGQLETAILNLAINARDAMPEGGTLTIRTTTIHVASDGPPHPAGLRAGDYVALGVCDEGIGMSEEVAARAFEPFFTTKGVGRGTGLGLSMVHGLASQSGGGVHLESRPGSGTSVTLYLPRAGAGSVPYEGGALHDSPRDAPALLSPPLVPAETETPDRGTRVLLAEDETLVRLGMVAMLEEAGFAVTAAPDGAEALELLSGEAVDVLVTDVRMPGMTGLELARAARRRYPDLPIIFITGYANSAELEAASSELRTQVLAKPCMPDILIGRIRDVLQGQPSAGRA